MKLWIFFAGFLTNAIVWRLQEHKYDDILYPVALLICAIVAIIVHPRIKPWTSDRKPATQPAR